MFPLLLSVIEFQWSLVATLLLSACRPLNSLHLISCNFFFAVAAAEKGPQWPLRQLNDTYDGIILNWPAYRYGGREIGRDS